LLQERESSPHLSPQFVAERGVACRVDCAGSDESSVHTASVARNPGLPKPIQRDAKGPLRRYRRGLLFELLAVELVTLPPSLLFSLPRRLRAARPYLSFPSF
jgi:hypothetical protein